MFRNISFLHRNVKKQAFLKIIYELPKFHFCSNFLYKMKHLKFSINVKFINFRISNISKIINTLIEI